MVTYYYAIDTGAGAQRVDGSGNTVPTIPIVASIPEVLDELERLVKMPNVSEVIISVRENSNPAPIQQEIINLGDYRETLLSEDSANLRAVLERKIDSLLR
jgi:hypothetical protein